MYQIVAIARTNTILELDFNLGTTQVEDIFKFAPQAGFSTRANIF